MSSHSHFNPKPINRVRGNVLIAVLVILTLSLFPLIAGLQSTLYQTRLTGGIENYAQLRATAMRSLSTAIVAADATSKDEALPFSPTRLHTYSWSGESGNTYLIEQVAAASTTSTESIYLILTARAENDYGGKVFARALYERTDGNPSGTLRKVWWIQ